MSFCPIARLDAVEHVDDALQHLGRQMIQGPLRCGAAARLGCPTETPVANRDRSARSEQRLAVSERPRKSKRRILRTLLGQCFGRGLFLCSARSRLSGAPWKHALSGPHGMGMRCWSDLFHLESEDVGRRGGAN